MSRTSPSPRDDRLGLDEFDQTKTQYPTVSGTGPFVYPFALDPESPKPIQNRFHCNDAQIDAQFNPPYPSFVDINDTNTSPNDHIGPGPSMTRWISSNDLCDPSLFNMDCEQLTTAETMGNNSDGISGFAPTMASPHDPTTTAMGSTLSGQPYPSTTVPGGSSSNNFEPATLSWFMQGTSSPSTTQTTSDTAASPRSTGHSASSRTNSIIYTPPSPTNTIEPIQLDYRIPPSPEEFPGKGRMSSASVSKRKEGREQEKRKSLTQAKPARGHEPCAKKSIQSPKETVTPDQLQKDTNSNDSNDHSLSEQSNESQLQKHRQSMLKRNCMAASKCRDKTKAAVADLEATEKAMCTEHYRLLTTVTGLREEVLMLKNELLKHGNCDCKVIQQYLTNAAKKIANGTAQGEAGVSSASS